MRKFETVDEVKSVTAHEVINKIVITTQQGNIDVILHRDGKEIDYNYTVDEDNDGYVQLETGRNYINYTADAGDDYMNVNFDFENCYIMP